MITCTRRLTFCAGHRVYGHESKCSNLHGHNYVIEATATGSLDSVGRIIDFSVIKDRLGKWLDDNWDHGMILHSLDRWAIHAVETLECASAKKQKLYLMDENPTAENMAIHLLDICGKLFEDAGIVIETIIVHETENCYARADLPRE